MIRYMCDYMWVTMRGMNPDEATYADSFIDCWTNRDVSNIAHGSPTDI